jgi:hypothetical protein
MQWRGGSRSEAEGADEVTGTDDQMIFHADGLALAGPTHRPDSDGHKHGVVPRGLDCLCEWLLKSGQSFLAQREMHPMMA